MKTAFVFPPQWYPRHPYLALPTLKAYLESKGHEVDQFDFNVESYDYSCTLIAKRGSGLENRRLSVFRTLLEYLGFNRWEPGPGSPYTRSKQTW